ncbi:MAG: DUF1538 family protein, partial [Oscillospiraceae bacterium]|nr:DUF1538 family protein [Oscillospiraceae bacterium]
TIRETFFLNQLSEVLQVYYPAKGDFFVNGKYLFEVGVASGPLTSSFILPMTIGACVALRGADAVMDFAFGVVALVAMTPLITIQALGFRSILSRIMRENAAIRRILSADDAQIIYFK